mmetsp:Transcript_4176/g.8973  ORF Transcript_4176/g.8973 Transcript_4176/m.8973 type:complete len:520 (-) Transcript_4176:328-1887(-)|eukprot:CAMPEP_0172458036 /NCGR_PEP_ID=MMETSP1065-20121228/25639_1 /TAXON_ID=265537 /ORGANISM="Amphiprora paludosa, Strain CCMP125" /LENGTH=519 /DNA_ID=CAMNT_0013212105 /DNA_START=131 /DNA_END=1690 /DNA_ORIENTATION=-
MAEQEGDDGIFQFGSSVSCNDELRRSAVADTEEIEKECAKVSESIRFEEDLRFQTEKDCSHARKEMDNLLQSAKDAHERLGMNDEILRGLFSTLKTELSSNDLYSLSPSTTSGTDSTLLDLTTEEGSLDSTPSNTVSVIALKKFTETTEKHVNSLRMQIENIQKSISSETEAMKALVEEAGKVEEGIASEGLETSLTKYRESTASKLQILEEIKARHGSLHTKISDSEDRLREVEKEVMGLTEQLSSRQKDTATKLADGEKVLYAEMQEESRLQEILRQVKIHDEEVKNELRVLKEKDAELLSCIQSKKEKVKQREELREKRNHLYSTKTEVGEKTENTKRKLDEAKLSLEKSEKRTEDIQKRKLRNDKRDAEVTLPAKSELNDLLAAKRTSEEFLEESRKPVEDNRFTKETGRLAELRSKRESLRKDFEAKKARLHESRQQWEGEEHDSEMDVESLRSIAKKTSSLLKDAQDRVAELKSRRAKREEAIRKLTVIRNGVALLERSKQVERQITVLGSHY